MEDLRFELKNEGGATSIFVILLMVALFVIGIAALTTSMASLRLSKKNVNWGSDYYTLESEAEKTLAKVDEALYDAEMTALKEVEASAATASVESLQQTFFTTYITSARRNLDFLLELYDLELFVSKTTDDTQESVSPESALYASYTVTDISEDIPKNITVLLKVEVPVYDFSLGQGVVYGDRQEPLRRYIVKQWKEWQPPFEYDYQIEFDDPVFEDPVFKVGD